MRPELAADWTDGTTGEWQAPGDSADTKARPNNELPQIEDAADLISKPIVLPDDVIEGIVHRGGKDRFWRRDRNLLRRGC